MRYTRRWLWLLGVLAAFAVVAAACGDDEEEAPPAATTPAAEETEPPVETPAELLTDHGVSDTEIVLGMEIVQSGNLAAVYQPVSTAVPAYLQKVNQEDGGVCGRSVRLVVEDDQYSPAVALEKARKLVEQDDILAFVGNLGTPPNTGSVDYINDPNGDGDTSDGIPDLWLSSGASKWGDYATWPWTTGFIPDYVSEGKILATHVNENFTDQSVAILFQNDDFGKDGRSGFVDTFTGEVLAEQSYESTATEITSQLANLRDADADILYLYATPAFTAQTFGYMQANNWQPQVVMSYVNSASTVASLVGGDSGPEAGFQAIAGTVSTNYLLDPTADADNPAVIEHVRIMEAYGGPPLSNLSLYGQAQGELIVETLRIACDNNDMTRAGVLAAAESIEGFVPSVIFPGIELNTGPTDHFAIQALVPTQIEADGTLTPLGEPISVE